LKKPKKYFLPAIYPWQK